MLRGSFNYPDLDVPDSPLMSPTPLTSGIPGSALAERIFNDPDSWEDNQIDDDDFPEDVSIDWLAEEFERFKRTSIIANPTMEKPVPLINTPTSAVHQNVRRSIRKEAGTGLKGPIGGKRGSVRPISLAALFDHSNEDFSSEIQQQLSKILETGGIPHHIGPYPSLSPPSSSDTASSIDSPLQIRTAAIGNNSGEISPSPVNIYSASATLSFLEWYGIYPDSPRLDLAGLPPKSLRMKTPLLQVPSPKHPMRPSPLLNSSETAAPPPAQRASPIPPPGLEPPPMETEITVASRRPSKTPSPPPVPRAPASSDNTDQLPKEQTARSRSESSSREGRRLPHTASPPYRDPSPPQPPIARSSSSGSNHSVTSSRPRRPDGGSFDSATHIRRLPSIPPEPSAARPQTPPQPLPEPPIQRTTSLNRASPSPAPPSSSASASSTVQQQQTDRRPVSVRSPLGGPAGPRVRTRTRENDILC
ncbi:hypothetical protein M413DRAFT_379607 [Hebeloma cylindrosporum]|uniref:Uncharacterized protein n=1 Tax=Hebeloma cylindrosporum TaxID=76867 RepID=A0A0C3CJT2_HEBCY|nr:hypothetical protein M413DRAFT_379607 [Hebeloma cylindrosporum h7]